jgi:hypothetical protein
MSIVKQWKLREGDKLEWSWEVVNSEMVLRVRNSSFGRKETKASKSIAVKTQ